MDVVTLSTSGWACQFSVPLATQLIITRVTNQVTGARHANRICYQSYRNITTAAPHIVHYTRYEGTAIGHRLVSGR